MINIQKKKILSGRIARFMESGIPVFTYEYLLKSADGDLDFLASCLNEWEAEGCIVWKKDLFEAKEGDDVACFGKFPEGISFWPPKLSGGVNEKSVMIDLWGDGKFVTDYPEKQLDFLKKYLPNMQILDR